MAEQPTFASLAWEQKGKVTRREQFLREMDAVVPWARLVAVVAPHYPTAGRGRPPVPLAVMLRIYFAQHWFNLSDPQAEDQLYDSESLRRFVGVELAAGAVPDETTICRFRHLLERHRLTEQLFTAVNALLEERQLLVTTGTIVDATILAAPSSTKNATRTRDPEMRQTRKGNQWHFGMKVHVGTDTNGTVHTLTTTDAAVADVTQLPELLHGDEAVLYGDRAYERAEDRAAWTARGKRYRVNERGERTAARRARNRARSRVRAKVEHVFHVVKRLWGFATVRYRGLAKNTARVYAAFALANLYLLRHRLGPQGT